MTMLPASSAFLSRAVSIDLIRALRKLASVFTPICAPVRLSAWWPSEWIAIAIRATLTCSPVERSMSISRAGGLSVILAARSKRSSVVSPMALTTMTTWFPSCCARIARRAARRIFSGVATDEPPNCWTIRGMGAGNRSQGSAVRVRQFANVVRLLRAVQTGCGAGLGRSESCYACIDFIFLGRGNSHNSFYSKHLRKCLLRSRYATYARLCIARSFRAGANPWARGAAAVRGINLFTYFLLPEWRIRLAKRGQSLAISALELEGCALVRPGGGS